VVVYPRFLRALSALPSNYHESTGALTEVFRDLAEFRLGASRPMFRAIRFGWMHLGLWMLPLFILTLPSWSGVTARSGRQKMIVALGVASAIVTAGFHLFGEMMPLGGNILVDFGLGPADLSGPRPRAPQWFWVAITYASAFGGVCLLVALGQVARRAITAIR